MVFDELNSIHSPGHDLIMAFFNCMSYLDVGCRDEDMNHADVGIDTGLCILFHNAGQSADLGLEAGSCDLPDALKLAIRGYRKTCLDDIDSEFVKLPGDLELLLLGQRYARSLLAISKCCVKNADFFINKRTNVVEDDSPQKFRVSYPRPYPVRL